jgi:LemA protein
MWILGGIALLAVLGVSGYNALVRRRNVVDQAYSTIEVQLVQRYDLIPKLVETVKQYMSHERGLLEEIVRLRSRAMSSTNAADKIQADNELTRAMGQLNVTMENYPQLKASENFSQLQRSLNEVE